MWISVQPSIGKQQSLMYSKSTCAFPEGLKWEQGDPHESQALMFFFFFFAFLPPAGRVFPFSLHVWHREPHQPVQHQRSPSAPCCPHLHHSEGPAVCGGRSQYQRGKIEFCLFFISDLQCKAHLVLRLVKNVFFIFCFGQLPCICQQSFV